MPELPEVETARSLVQGLIGNQKIIQVWTQPDPIVYANCSHLDVRRALTNARVHAVRRAGKHLWIELKNGPHVAFHLGMTGSFLLRSSGQPRNPFAKLELYLGDQSRLAFLNKRRLGRIRLHQNAEQEPPICNLGWDPMTTPPTSSEFYTSLQKRRTPIKALLLNQQFIAGIGNWIADEILFQSGIHPATHACRLTQPESARLLRTMLRVITLAVRVKADDRQFPKSWLFHHRWGKNPDAKTSQGESLAYCVVGGRTTAFVPARQQRR